MARESSNGIPATISWEPPEWNLEIDWWSSDLPEFASRDEIEEVRRELVHMKLYSLATLNWRLKSYQTHRMFCDFLNFLVHRRNMSEKVRMCKVDWNSKTTFAKVFDLPEEVDFKNPSRALRCAGNFHDFFEKSDLKFRGYFLEDCKDEKLRKVLRVLNPIFFPQRCKQVQKKFAIAVKMALSADNYAIDWADFLHKRFFQSARECAYEADCFLSSCFFHVYNHFNLLTSDEKEAMSHRPGHTFATQGSQEVNLGMGIKGIGDAIDKSISFYRALRFSCLDIDQSVSYCNWMLTVLREVHEKKLLLGCNPSYSAGDVDDGEHRLLEKYIALVDWWMEEVTGPKKNIGNLIKKTDLQVRELWALAEDVIETESIGDPEWIAKIDHYLRLCDRIDYLETPDWEDGYRRISDAFFIFDRHMCILNNLLKALLPWQSRLNSSLCASKGIREKYEYSMNTVVRSWETYFHRARDMKTRASDIYAKSREFEFCLSRTPWKELRQKRLARATRESLEGGLGDRHDLIELMIAYRRLVSACARAKLVVTSFELHRALLGSLPEELLSTDDIATSPSIKDDGQRWLLEKYRELAEWVWDEGRGPLKDICNVKVNGESQVLELQGFMEDMLKAEESKGLDTAKFSLSVRRCREILSRDMRICKQSLDSISDLVSLCVSDKRVLSGQQKDILQIVDLHWFIEKYRVLLDNLEFDWRTSPQLDEHDFPHSLSSFWKI